MVEKHSNVKAVKLKVTFLLNKFLLDKLRQLDN